MVTTTETVQFLSNLTLWLRMQNVHISHLRIVEFYLQNIFFTKKNIFLFKEMNRKPICCYICICKMYFPVPGVI